MEQTLIKSMLFWVINGFVFKLVTHYRDFATQYIRLFTIHGSFI